MPTKAELLTEIQSGPLAATLAPLAAAMNSAGVLAVLSDPTRRTKPGARKLALAELATDGGFAPASVAAVFNHPRFPDFNLAVNNQNVPGAIAIASLFASLGVVTPADLTAFTAYATTPVSTPCSRLAELGWNGVTQDSIHKALGGS